MKNENPEKWLYQPALSPPKPALGTVAGNRIGIELTIEAISECYRASIANLSFVP